jgi:hypothetical protein
MIKLDDKLYTSTEVAVILGVSLRSVYRYIEENKLVPEVKTATGRHRFTKQNIIDFLYPEGTEGGNNMNQEDERKPVQAQTKKAKIEKKVTEEEEVQPIIKEKETPKRVEIEKEEEKEEVVEKTEEPVDWLSKFREAARKFEEESAEKEERKEPVAPRQEVPSIKEKFTKLVEEEVQEKQAKYFYRSRLGGLKDIAQNIDKASKNSGLDYAFTMNAGLSLHSPIKPFSLLHVYVRAKDKDFFERILMLTPTDEENAQLCMLSSEDNKIYNTSMTVHGLSVVSKEKLLSDIRDMDTEGSLTREAEGILG